MRAEEHGSHKGGDGSSPAPGETEETGDPSLPNAAVAGATTRILLGTPDSAEPEVAVSNDGQTVVVVQQIVWRTSNDGGNTFPLANFGDFTVVDNVPGVGGSRGGDSSLAVGQSGSFYEGTIGINAQSLVLNVAPPKGTPFAFRSLPFTCQPGSIHKCFVLSSGQLIPDQEHIASDRVNATATGDQVYVAWRMVSGEYGVVCSTNGGATFPASATVNSFTPGDFPRITVGRDGFVYVVYQTGNAVQGNIMLNKYAPCSVNPNMAQQPGFPVMIAKNVTFTACPVPGLDRCNNGNNLSSFTVAVDDTNPAHVYVAYAVNTAINTVTGAGNDDVIVQDSLDGGATWPAKRAVTVSSTAFLRAPLHALALLDGRGSVRLVVRPAGRRGAGGRGQQPDRLLRRQRLARRRRQPGPGPRVPDQRAGHRGRAVRSWPGPRERRGPLRIPELAVRLPRGQRLRKLLAPAPARRALHPAGRRRPRERAGVQPQRGQHVPCPPDLPDRRRHPEVRRLQRQRLRAGRFFNVWASATPPPGIPKSGGVDLFFAQRQVTHDLCNTGGPLPSTPGTCPGYLCTHVNASCCTTSWSGDCVREALSFCPPAGFPVPCQCHSVCSTGLPNDFGCPGFPAFFPQCTALVCNKEPSCCISGWTQACVTEAEALCNPSCDGP